ncbi:kelch-like protein 10 [Thalassophryne amazonica]|uniref:kelch-like protein 10 n=1 Tax=Thalassophryne amazonica TaxID=390379 RepID=UPI001470F41F|nr:kelch-like protein 10 [Thalassophryne amazonica]
MDNSDKPFQIMSSTLNEMRLEGDFIDAEIRVQNATFPIHKVILANCSPYFRDLFSRQTVYTVSEYSPEIMQLIIEFAYTNTVLVTDDNVEELFCAADHYGIAGLIHACITFLEEHLCPQNCINICHLADKLGYAELGHKAYNFLFDHFESCIDSSGFLQLSLEELKDIIKKDEVIVREESIVLEAILRWIAHSPNQRNSHIFVLLSKVHLPLCSTEYLRNNIESVIHRDPHFINVSGCPRFPTAILFATGGWHDGRPTSEIEVYDICADRWVDLPNSLEETCAYHGTVFLDGSLYCVGGYNGVAHCKTLRFDLSTRIWHREAQMQVPRCYVSVCVLNGLIYAMGGNDGIATHNSAERYDPQTDRWTFIAPMHERRSEASCAVLYGKVYICGGLNRTLHYLSSAEFYDPETDRWTEIAPMTSQRGGLGVVAHGGCIYAVGGNDRTSRLRSAEVYSLDTHRWAPLPSMHVPRSNFGIEVLEDMIVVAGGFDGSRIINTVECYNIRAAQWSMMMDMGTSRCGLSCCVVSGIPNMREYVPVRDQPQDYDMEEDLCLPTKPLQAKSEPTKVSTATMMTEDLSQETEERECLKLENEALKFTMEKELAPVKLQCAEELKAKCENYQKQLEAQQKIMEKEREALKAQFDEEMKAKQQNYQKQLDAHKTEYRQEMKAKQELLRDLLEAQMRILEKELVAVKVQFELQKQNYQKQLQQSECRKEMKREEAQHQEELEAQESRFKKMIKSKTDKAWVYIFSGVCLVAGFLSAKFLTN